MHSLRALKHYLSEKRLVRLNTLCQVFDCDVQSLQPMVDYFVRKGLLRVIEPQTNPASCSKGCSDCGVGGPALGPLLSYGALGHLST